MNVFRTIDELEQLAENSKGGLLGKRLINEEEFLAKIHQLRSVLPASPNALRVTNELEQLVRNSRGGWFGKRLINEEEFFTKIQQLRSALSWPR